MGAGRSSTARDRSIPYFIFKGGLVDPRLRASNEHILIVRVPRAQKIISLHPLLGSASKEGTWPLPVPLLCRGDRPLRSD
jgi:hypothetical protein